MRTLLAVSNGRAHAPRQDMSSQSYSAIGGERISGNEIRTQNGALAPRGRSGHRAPQ